jgi:hypothetical protein
VFRDFEQVQNAEESRLTRQFRSNIGKPCRLNRLESPPSSIRYLAPTLTWGRVQIRTLQVISPRRTPSRRRLVNVMNRVYENTSPLAKSDKHGKPVTCVPQLTDGRIPRSFRLRLLLPACQPPQHLMFCLPRHHFWTEGALTRQESNLGLRDFASPTEASKAGSKLPIE